MCRFLTDEKTTKRVAETSVSDSHASAEKRIHTARKVLQCSQSSHRPPSAVRRLCASEKPAPVGARRAPCERFPARCQRKWRRLTDHARFASVDAVFHSRHRTAAGRTNGQAGGLQFLFVLFLSDGEKNALFIFSESAFPSRSYTDGARRARSPNRRRSDCFRGRR